MVMILKKADNTSSSQVLSELSEMDFLILGREEIAYMRPTQIDGEEAIELHAADGTMISVLASEELAAAMARQQDLKPVALQ